MRTFFTRRAIVFLAVALIVGVSVGVMKIFQKVTPPLDEASPTVTVPHQKTIGSSVEGRAIDAYTFGTGTSHLVFVGGVHGGYEWNSVLLAYTLIDYLTENPTKVPAELSVTVIPSLNPDGVYQVVKKEGRFTARDASEHESDIPGLGRFNANDVDLNRNFDCKWKPESTWKGKVVSAGTEAFSEPEASALKNFVEKNNPTAFVFYHSQANAVYASECEDGILPQTRTLMNTYAQATGYPSVDSFDAYPISGDAEGWLASIGIPAITVELKTHETVEWDKNLLGIEALFEYYSKK